MVSLARRNDPIIAIATAPGRAAVGIVRASGRNLAPLISAVCRRTLAPRVASLLPFLDADGSVIDQGLAIHFPAPHSYTGEEVLELQAHGGPVVLQLLLARCLAALPHARPAEPGEFTERAFLHDKLDLAQAEAVADLIDASTEAAARSAGRSLAGVFSQLVQVLAERLVALRTLVEATLDFPEEEIDFLQRADAAGQLAAIASALQQLRAQARQGALLREGLRVVLAGQPNVGKSSLLNALAGAELAIVTPIPGTTRDRVSESIQIEGVPLHVTDTAGLRDSHGDEIERIGIQRSWGAIESADVVLFLRDLTRRGDRAYDAADAVIESRLPAQPVRIEVWNKADVSAAAGTQRVQGLAISARTGAGLPALRAALLEAAGWRPAAEGLFTARARHLAALDATATHVANAKAQLEARSPALELLAEELRLAHEALGAITGVYSADDLLGAIFGRFCIGK